MLWVTLFVCLIVVLIFIVKKRTRIVISLTTIPGRLDTLADITKNLNEQTMKPDEIAINVPHVFKRTEETYDLSKIPPYMTVYRCDDYGPATKFYPTILREKDKNTLIIVLDDDIQYKLNMVETIYNNYVKYPNMIQSADSNHVMEAFAVYAFPTSIIDDDFEEFFKVTQTNEYCFRGDDLVIDYYMRSKGKQKAPVDHHRSLISDEKEITVKDTTDGLSNMPDAKTKYLKCEKYLLESKWVTPTNFQHLSEL